MSERNYQIPATVSSDDFITHLTDMFSIKVSESIENTCSYYDSFDWRLYRAGFALSVERDYLKLSTIRTWQPVALQPLNEQTTIRFWWDIPAGDVQTHLKKVLDVRALLPVFSVNQKELKINILNQDKKTVARVHWMEGERSDEQRAVFCILQPVKGYVRETDAIIQMMVAIGLTEQPATLFDWAVRQVQANPGSYATKPQIDLNADTPAHLAVKKILLHLLSIMQQNLPGIRDDIDTEFVHDFRVAIRRTRSALSQIKGVFTKEQVKDFRSGFSALGKATNRLRDLDVYLLNKQTYQDMLPSELQPGLNGFFDEKQQQRTVEFEHVINALFTQGAELLLKRWNEFLNDPAVPDAPLATTPILDVAKNIILKSYEGVIESGDQITDDSPESELHGLRIRCKKLRYMLEFFQTLFPEQEMTHALKILKNLQGCLGNFNDLAVQRRSLEHYLDEMTSRSGKAIVTAAAIGGLVSRLFAQQIQVRKQFGNEYQLFRTPEHDAIYRRLFETE
ncbi:CHAD domain-containing protein [candidate division KSB1 bacterium]|nr:CHAD domain-containing protein [candidate division KSB1 bacterium]